MRMLIAIVGLLFCVPLHAAEAPAAFGEKVEGLSVALSAGTDGIGKAAVVIRNDGAVPVRLQGAFAWLLMVESREVASFTDKVAIDASGEIAPSAELRTVVSLQDLQAQPYQKGIKVVDGYPQKEGDAAVPARTAADVLRAPMKAQAIVFVPAGGQKLTLRSKVITLSISRTASSQPAEMMALVERFRRDAFAARDAADAAVGKGAAAIPALVEALHDPAMPDFGQMWIAAALTRIGGEQGAAAVVALVDDAREGIRNVAAFHGPTMRQKAVDDAILKRAKAGNDPLFTAWAARGFAEHGRALPPGLVDAAFGSTEPRARAEIAEVLATSKDPADANRLAKLFADDAELVRMGAADAVARHPQQPRAVLNAMVAALEGSGNTTRGRIVTALARCAGRPWEYSPEATAEQNAAVLDEIRAWVRTQK